MGRACGVGVAIAGLFASSCYRVAETTPSELVKLSEHDSDRPAVTIRTVDGDPVEIDGDFSHARVVVDSGEGERVIVLRPPFRVAAWRGQLHYQRRGRQPLRRDLEDVRRVRVTQRDGNRTLIVLPVIVVSTLVGVFGAAYLDAQQNEQAGPGICALCAPMFGGMLFGGLSTAIVLPSTKYY